MIFLFLFAKLKKNYELRNLFGICCVKQTKKPQKTGERL